MIKLPFLNIKRTYKTKPVVLVVLDGYGTAPVSNGNAITLAKKPNIDRIEKTYPHTLLIASGESVGLPANEVGNTEVGHLTLGAGRTILQDLKRINYAIEKGTFYDNKALVACAEFVKSKGSRMHILGLASSGNVHSNLDHLQATMQFCKKEGINDVYLHLFTDGRDAPPNEGLEIIFKVEKWIDSMKIGKIASIAGRYYAMDRDRRWDRTAKAYNAIVSGKGNTAPSAMDAVKNAYAKGQTDEFIEPTVICNSQGPIGIINDNDGVIFFNYRVDRPRQLTMSIVIPDFENLKEFDFGYDPSTNQKIKDMNVGTTFKREKTVKDIFFVTMTEYKKGLEVSGIAFGPEVVVHPLGEMIAQKGYNQLHMSESEKERFVTYYFNGLREEKFAGEEVKIIKSPNVGTYDKKPEMSLPKLVDEFIAQIKRDIFGFAVINFANPDMVAHTGNLQASIIAIEHVDRHLQRLVNTVLDMDGTILITADHGNAEELITYPSSTYFVTSDKGVVNTDHSNYPVPLYIVNKSIVGKRLDVGVGSLADIAPTVLYLLGIEKPLEMTGNNILAGLK